MNITQALGNATKKLSKEKIISASLDAEVILSFVLNKSKEYLFAYPEKKLTVSQQNKFQLLTNKRAKLYPIAYLINNKEFFNLNFFVDQNVLIPRPETELIVAEVLNLLNSSVSKHPTFHCQPPIIWDIGTGSGCLAISIAKNSSNIRVSATDISHSALKIAKRNAARHHVSLKIKFYHGHLLEPMQNKKADIVIANLPYLPDNKIDALKREPALALYAGKNGLALYEKLFQQIKTLKYKPTFILIEIDPRQTASIEKIIKQYLPKSKIKIIKDLSGLARIIKIKLCPRLCPSHQMQ